MIVFLLETCLMMQNWICFRPSFKVAFFQMGVKLQALSRFDAFPRTEEHLLKKTKSGAVGRFDLISVY